MKKINSPRRISTETIPSEFGDVTYYELLRSVIRRTNEMVVEINQSFDDMDAFKTALIKRQSEFETTLNSEFDSFVATANANYDAFTKLTEGKYTDFTTDITGKFNEFTTGTDNKYNIFTTTINTRVDNFEDTVNNVIADMKADITSFQTSVSNDIAKHKADVDTRVTAFENNVTAEMTQHKKDVDTRVTAFETDMTNKYTTFTNTIDVKVSDFITLSNTNYTTFTTNVNDIIAKFKADISTQVNGLSTEFDELKVYVTNYLDSTEFNDKINVVVSAYLSTPEFKTYVEEIVTTVVSENAILSTGGTMSGELIMENDIAIQGVDKENVKHNILVLDWLDAVNVGTYEKKTNIRTSERPQIFVNNQVFEDMAYLTDFTDYVKTTALETVLKNYLKLTGGNLTGLLTTSGGIQLSQNAELKSYTADNLGVSLARVNGATDNAEFGSLNATTKIITKTPIIIDENGITKGLVYTVDSGDVIIPGGANIDVSQNNVRSNIMSFRYNVDTVSTINLGDGTSALSLNGTSVKINRSKVMTISDYNVAISSDVVMEPNDQAKTLINFNFPTGFNGSNCVIEGISINPNDTQEYYNCYYESTSKTTFLVSAILFDSVVSVSVIKIGTSTFTIPIGKIKVYLRKK